MMDAGNENENKNAGEVVLTVAEAAALLNVTIPRLRRLLARPDFAPLLRQQERRTRTGTRTSTVIPESVLVSLQAIVESGETSFPGQEAEQEREQERNRNGNEHAALREAFQSDILFLRRQAETHAQEIARRDIAEAELRRLLLADRQEIARLREQLALAAAPQVPGSQVAADMDNHAQETAEAVRSQPEPPPARKWFEFWKRG
jgi:hypothetical protein